MHQESTSFIIVVKVAGYKSRGMMSSLHKQGSKRTYTSRVAGGIIIYQCHQSGRYWKLIRIIHIRLSKWSNSFEE